MNDISNRLCGVRERCARLAAVVLLANCGALVAVADTIPATSADFQQGGTPPLTPLATLQTSGNCMTCHGNYDVEGLDPGFSWRGSMHAQSARDPLMLAARAIANQDVANSGETCIRCHSPLAFLGGRATPSDGSALLASDLDGVTCHICHRMVDPEFKPGISPAVDGPILDDLDSDGFLPVTSGNGQYVIDPVDRRRGPFGDLPAYPSPFPYHDWLESAFHRSSEICATCHDVSNPVLERQPDGTYAIGTLGLPHSTLNKHDMFPEQRTYSEWLFSDFAAGPVEMGGRFGGNKTAVSTCQDCHMADVTGQGCRPQFGPPVRDDLPHHTFAGANTWIHDALIAIEGPSIDPVLEDALLSGKAANIAMLQLAADLDLTQSNGFVRARVTNQTGHKLPTGYPEGRRMWLNLRCFDSNGVLIAERGAYDQMTAHLTTVDTKVYEVLMGLDNAMSGASGVPVGKSFHLVLNNTIEKDNRIPPRGFTNANFEALHIPPVGHTYADGQYWDDTMYLLPLGTASVEARLKYQTSSREYIEFLRDANSTGTQGQEVYDLWVLTGMSAPVTMVMADAELDPFPVGDADGDGDLDLADFAEYQLCFAASPVPPCDEFDIDVDGNVDLADLELFTLRLTGPQ